jgi:GAF domain-containing protein
METIRRFFSAPAFEDDEKTRAAELVNTVLISILSLGIVAGLAMLIAGITRPGQILAVFALVLIMLGLKFPLQAGYVKPVAIGITITLTTIITAITAIGGTVRSPSVVIFILASVIAGLSIGRRAAYWSAGVNILIFSVLVWGQINNVLPTPNYRVNYQQLVIFSSTVVMIVILLNQALRRIKTSLELAETNQEQLMILNQELEERVAARVGDLKLASDIGQSLALVRDPETMLDEAVEMIRERFDLYYTQIYLTDPSERTLTLRAGTGDVGQTLLQRGQNLPVDMSSINGIAAVERRAVVVEDTEASTLHRSNPLLPETRSEMAIPLISGDRVLGVLDMQSSQPGALREENLTAFETLASQLAITLVNTELFTDLENARREVEAQARRTTRDGWQAFLDAIERPERIGYRFEENDLEPLDRPLTGVLDDSQAMVVPIKVAGEMLGSFQLEGRQNWSPEDVEMVEDVAERVAQQIENLRLLAQSQRYQQEAQEAVRRLTREGWEKAEQLLTNTGYIYDDDQVKPLSSSDNGEEQAWIQEILVSDEPIGEIGIKETDRLSPEDAEFVATIGEQLAAHLENLRLTEQTQNQAQREQALRQITAAVRGSTDPENIMRTAVRELGRVLGRRAVVRLRRSGDGADGQA